MPIRPRRNRSRSHPRRALVLAAGFGSRLDPLTQLVPKPVVPLWGESLVSRVLRHLEAWGVEHVVVNLHHAADETRRAVERARPAGMELAFSHEPLILGTGGALRAAAWHFSDGQPFWIVNADVAMDLDPRPLIQGLDGEPGALSNVWMIPDAGPRTVGLKNGRIATFRHPRPGTPGTATFSGVQLVRPEIFNYVPNAPFSTLVQVYEEAIRAGWKILGTVLPHDRWADVGTIEGLLAAHDVWRDERAGSRNPDRPWDWAPERGAHRARGARTRRCVAMSGSRLGRHAVAFDTILSPGAELRREGTGIIVPAAVALTSPELNALERLDRGHRETPWMAHALPARGSGRRFFRIEGHHRSFILIRDAGERAENRLYPGHARFLKRLGLPVPELMAVSAPGEPRFEIFSDGGMRSLGDVVHDGGWSAATPWYERVVDTLVRWHQRGGVAARRSRLEMERAFGPDVYGYEHGLFLNEFARGRCGCGEDTILALQHELERASDHLLKAPSMLVHRDLQSSNILCSARGPVWIDFQGMRMGPAVYDLASLLYDPYVEMPAELRSRWTRRYVRRAGASSAQVERLPWAAVQRLTQALGAFARLSRGPAQAQFERHIPAGLRMLSQALDELGEPMPALRALIESHASAPAAVFAARS